MSTIGNLQGIAADAFAPFQSDPTPAPTPGGPELAFVDPAGQVMGRGLVLTDEGTSREGFADPAVLSVAPWSQINSGGGSIVVAGGIATFSAGLVASGSTYAVIPIDYLPLQANLDLLAIGRPTLANSPDFFFGFYDRADVDAAILSGEYAEILFRGADTATTGILRSSAGTPANIQSTSGTITSTAARGFRTLTLTPESAQFRDGTTTLPTTTTRFTHSTKIPGVETELFFAFGYRNGPAPVGAWSMQCQAILFNNVNVLSTRVFP